MIQMKPVSLMSWPEEEEEENFWQNAPGFCMVGVVTQKTGRSLMGCLSLVIAPRIVLHMHQTSGWSMSRLHASSPLVHVYIYLLLQFPQEPKFPYYFPALIPSADCSGLFNMYIYFFLFFSVMIFITTNRSTRGPVYPAKFYLASTLRTGLYEVISSVKKICYYSDSE